MNWFNRSIYIILVTIFWIGTGLLSAPALAGPSWDKVSQQLQQRAGALQKGEYLFATGMAQAEILDDRAGKAHERARKKSLARAMRQLHLTASCKTLLADLSLTDRQIFAESFVPLLPDLHVNGLSIVRQWQNDRKNFTTVALPVAAMEDIPCLFPSLDAAIAGYLQDSLIHKIDGLSFCLQHTARYSNSAKLIRRRIAQLYQTQGLNRLAQPFQAEEKLARQYNSLDFLALQHLISRADKLIKTAKKQITDNKADQAILTTFKILQLIPSNAPANFIIAEYFMGNPAMALVVIEKGLRPGTHLLDGLNLQIKCLEELGSDEVEIWKYLLNQAIHETTGFPAEWEKELELLKDSRIVSLVIASSGQAVEGSSRQADPEFNRAVELYGKVKNDDDLLKVLSLLISAAEKEPYSAQTWNLIGACYRNLNRPLMALPFLWQALKLRPNYDLALTNLALCCRELKLMKAAQYYFEYETVKNSANEWVRMSYIEYQEKSK